MGMDVYGKNAKGEAGKYFRNNVWWWHPLAGYCLLIAPTVTAKCKMWHSNDGDGLGESDSLLLAALLRAEIESGRCAKYDAEYKAHLETLPRKECDFCHGTGSKKHDGGHGDRVEEVRPCHVCSGQGSVPSFEASYPFSVENVQGFVTFLENCGGFEIC